ncbi:MAG: hypothetical protein U0574_11415 [Phycisphaerales bacterium]
MNALLEGDDLDNLVARAVSYELQGPDAVVELKLDPQGIILEQPNWRVVCRGVWHSRTTDTGPDLKVFDHDHPLSRQHTDWRADLYFRGAPRSASLVIGQLFTAHQHAFRPWIPFERYLGMVQLQELLEGGFGQLAAGPEFVLEVYIPVLQANGVLPSLVRTYKPKRDFSSDPNGVAPSLAQLGHFLVLAERFDVAPIA